MIHWHSPEEIPEKHKYLVVQTNYGFMCGFQDYNGLFTPYEPYRGNVLRALQNKNSVRLIRWRYKYKFDTRKEK